MLICNQFHRIYLLLVKTPLKILMKFQEQNILITDLLSKILMLL